MIRQKNIKIVRVDWVDSFKTSGWTKYGKANLRCTSVGVLLQKAKDRVIVAQTISHNEKDSVADYIEIPKCSIISMRRLK